MRLALFLACLCCMAPAARAEEPDGGDARARELFDNGSMLYDEGRYEDAVVAFQAAYELSRKPLLLYNIASALERIGRWEEALEALNTYRAFAPAEERATLESRIRNIQNRIRDRGETPVPAPAPEPVPVPVPVAAPEPLVEPTTARRGRPAALILIGSGAAGIGVASAFTAMTLTARSQWQGACTNGLCPTSAAPQVQRDHTAGAIADVSWIVGLGALGGGVAIALGGRKAGDLEVSVRPGQLWLSGRLP